MRTTTCVLFALLLLAACSDPDASEICDDPSGDYTAILVWTDGTCTPGEDGLLTFSIVDEGAALWTADLSTFDATGTVAVVRGAAGCLVEVTAASTDGTADYNLILVASDDADGLTGFGYVDIDEVGGASCSHNYDLSSIEWTP